MHIIQPAEQGLRLPELIAMEDPAKQSMKADKEQ